MTPTNTTNEIAIIPGLPVMMSLAQARNLIGGSNAFVIETLRVMNVPCVRRVCDRNITRHYKTTAILQAFGIPSEEAVRRLAKYKKPKED